VVMAVQVDVEPMDKKIRMEEAVGVEEVAGLVEMEALEAWAGKVQMGAESSSTQMIHPS
jgi:molybdenum cofactor biosynthesis enzyme